MATKVRGGQKRVQRLWLVAIHVRVLQRTFRYNKKVEEEHESYRPIGETMRKVETGGMVEKSFFKVPRPARNTAHQMGKHFR